MGVISIRLPDDIEAELSKAGVKIAETAKKDLLRLAQDLRLKRREATLAKYSRPASRPVADLVREARDEH